MDIASRRVKQGGGESKATSRAGAASDLAHRHTQWIARSSVAADLTSSVAIIVCNKLLMSRYGFRFPVTLTAAHFAVTSVAIAAIRLVTQSAAPSASGGGSGGSGSGNGGSGSGNSSSNGIGTAAVPLAPVVAFAMLSSGAIILSNASLFLNSVAFYQIMKLATLPFIAFLEIATRTRSYSLRHGACFAVIMFGVGITIRGSMRTSVPGALTAVLSVMMTGCHQFFCGKLQSHFNVTPATLLSQVAPLKAVIILLCAPMLDRVWFGSVLDLSSVSGDALWLAAATCLLAVIVNVAQYSVINYYGAGLFQAMSQLKTAIIIYGWSLAFEGTVSPVQGVGTLISILGAYLLIREKQKAAGTVVTRRVKGLDGSPSKSSSSVSSPSISSSPSSSSSLIRASLVVPDKIKAIV